MQLMSYKAVLELRVDYTGVAIRSIDYLVRFFDKIVYLVNLASRYQYKL